MKRVRLIGVIMVTHKGINTLIIIFRREGTWDQSEGDKGRKIDAGHGGRSRNIERGTDASIRGWRVVGVVKVQVDDVTYQERRWRVSVHIEVQ